MANRHSAFQRFPYPDCTLYPDDQAHRLADLHARLDTCALSYLTALGRPGGSAQDALADTISGIRRLVRPGCTPLNGYLLTWLRFANLLAYAVETGLDH
ncbi:hypothetical protein ACG5V6_05605 [Streptomyces chitinivorans]|uniref:Uncharacterized protein n=1 Tax=Streptomyces chitinivorans TaxID=1257027 RepID=A0ABW7HPX8_9ACTN|nr:hypothetical protein [Streptomyces chitinivorans]MDH2410307.1 hypothetical protein [Streptomyces chitinivorans]